MLAAALEALDHGGGGGGGGVRWVIPCVLTFAVFVRLLVSTHGYSGEGTPPMFGDYEAGAGFNGDSHRISATSSSSDSCASNRV